jgi:anti-anti-sigma factor
MAYNINIEIKESLLFLRPRDRELGPEQAEKLKALIKAKAGPGTAAVIINFSAVEYMSSVFLSALMEISKELKSKSMPLGLAQLGTKVLEILKVTKLDTIFKIFDDSYQAYIAFAKSSGK